MRPPLPAPLTLPLGVLLALSGPAAAQDPVVTEFQASNAGTLVDEDGDESDWIELFNPAAQVVDLSGWYLSDDGQEPDRWALPAGTSIGPGGFLVVFASGKDRATAGAELHTDFKLEKDGESVLLVRPDGATVVSSFEDYPPQETGASFGTPFDPGPTGGESFFALPTPALPNGPGGPLVLDVAHAPALPTPGQELVVTARVPDLGGGAAELLWRAGYDPEQRAPLRDDGLPPDQVAGDGLFSGALPAAAATAGAMLRYRLRAVDGAGHDTLVPLFPDPENSPEYYGTMVADPGVSSALPVLWWWVENPVWAMGDAGTRASVFYDGEFYDNVLVRRRGGSSLFWPKRSYKFDFNKGQRLRFDDGPRADELDLNSTWSDKSFVRQVLCYEIYRRAGCVASEAFPVRVQQNGAFHSVAAWVEEPGEEAFLERHGLDPEGALYKMFNECTSWKKWVRKMTRTHENKADLKKLVQGVKLTGRELEAFLFDNVDLPAVACYLAATTLIHDNDHVAKNYYLYRDSDGDREWRFVPWDKDLTLGRNYQISGGVLNDKLWADVDPYSHPLFGDQAHPKNDGPWNRLIDAVYRDPRAREIVMRRLRTVMDELLQDPYSSSTERVLERRLRELQFAMAADVALDQAAWGIPSWGKDFDFAADLNRMVVKYLEPRRVHLYETHGPGGTALVPPPHDHPPIVIRQLEGDPSSGNPEHEFVRLSNMAGRSADLSGWSLEGGIAFTFEPGTVIGAGGELFVSPKPFAFRKRPTSPTGGEGHLVIGPYAGFISPGETVRLLDRDGVVVDEQTY